MVNAEYFIISVVEDNSYGHPNEEVLDRAEKLGFKITPFSLKEKAEQSMSRLKNSIQQKKRRHCKRS